MNKSISRIGTYTLSVLDTLRDVTLLYHTDSLESAERKARNLVNVMESANAVILDSVTRRVVAYVERDEVTA